MAMLLATFPCYAGVHLSWLCGLACVVYRNGHAT